MKFAVDSKPETYTYHLQEYLLCIYNYVLMSIESYCKVYTVTYNS